MHVIHRVQGNSAWFTVAVILITHFWAGALPIKTDAPLAGQLLIFIWSGYLFKVTAALLDTGPAYLAVGVLSRYLHIDRNLPT